MAGADIGRWRRAALWGANTVHGGLAGAWCLVSPMPFAARLWICACALLVGVLVLLCVTHLVDRAPVVGVTSALVATSLCAGLALAGVGMGAVLAFVVGVGTAIVLRRLRASQGPSPGLKA